MGKGDQMEWFEAVDGYCERVDAAFWSEPINAVTNAAFLIAAHYISPCQRSTTV